MISLLDFTTFNTSQRKKIVFRIGYDAGFFSEFNNMVLTIHYCLINKIQFSLNSEGANFSYKKGWQDFFQSFCEEDNFVLHRYYNTRLAKPVAGKKRDKILLYIYNKYLQLKDIRFLTYDLLPLARAQEPLKTYTIKELGLTNSLLDNCRLLVKMIWKFEPETKAEINKIGSKINLPEQFISFHIRRGDKKKEVAPISLEEFIKAAEKATSIRDVFISTDDFSVFSSLQTEYKNWNFYTLSDENETGYFQNEFDKKNKLVKRMELLKFFSSIEIMSQGELCFGTYSSNIGMFLALKMEKGKFIGVDFDNWKIW